MWLANWSLLDWNWKPFFSPAWFPVSLLSSSVLVSSQFLFPQLVLASVRSVCLIFPSLLTSPSQFPSSLYLLQSVVSLSRSSADLQDLLNSSVISLHFPSPPPPPPYADTSFPHKKNPSLLVDRGTSSGSTNSERVYANETNSYEALFVLQSNFCFLMFLLVVFEEL